MDSRIYSQEMISNMKSKLDNATSKFITYPKFVFLCGKVYSSTEYDNSNRGIAGKYLQRDSDAIFIVLSERLWEDNFNSNIDLLTFEEFLAEVSDAIILFVESPGSFCELGAFTYAEKLFSDKLIIIIDDKYKDSKSFINSGPVAKAKKDGSVIVNAPLDGTGLLSSSELRAVLDKKISDFKSKNSYKNKRTPNLYEKRICLNSFIIELLELVKILQPVSRDDLIEIYKMVKGFSHFEFAKKSGEKFHNEIKVDYIIKLLKTVGLINLDNNIITSDIQDKSQPFMFSYSKRSLNQERNKLLCRKYRYGALNGYN